MTNCRTVHIAVNGWIGVSMNNWRNDLPTEEQIVYIKEMQEFSEFPLPKFEGKTKGEASDYIDKWIKTAHYKFDYDSHGDNFGDRI